jgi:hypothetical protein
VCVCVCVCVFVCVVIARVCEYVSVVRGREQIDDHLHKRTRKRVSGRVCVCTCEQIRENRKLKEMFCLRLCACVCLRAREIV